MKSKLMIGSVVFGLFCGGVVVSQAFEGDISTITGTPVANVSSAADSIYTSYVTLSLSAKSAAQISQVADEASIRLNYLQVKQNAEVIRLLTALNNKK